MFQIIIVAHVIKGNWVHVPLAIILSDMTPDTIRLSCRISNVLNGNTDFTELYEFFCSL